MVSKLLHFTTQGIYLHIVGVYSMVCEKRNSQPDQVPDGTDQGKELEEGSYSISPSPEPAYSPELSEFLSEISNYARMSTDSHRSR